jgi:subtilisin family serine protease
MSISTCRRIRSHIHTRQQPRIVVLLLAVHVLLALSCLALPGTTRQPVQPPQLFIVQAASSDQAAAATARASGIVSRQLGIIGAVSAWLDAAALRTLINDPAIRAVYPDHVIHPALDSSSIAAQWQKSEPIEAPSVALNAVPLHQQNIIGRGVTVAVVDTGLAPLDPLSWVHKPDGSLMIAGKQPADGFVVFRDFVDPTGDDSVDPNGHGTHVVGSIVNNRKLKTSGQGAMGVAPGVNLVVARALDADGAGAYSTVIAAIDWVVQQRATYGIKVLNLSIYAPVASPYWADPLAQAVMRAWQAGLVVVVAAGNDGPKAATITVPANVPYVISVGALKSGLFTDSGGDELASFSARGPTESAFAKPDILVPAVRVVAPMPDDSVLATQVLAGRLTNKGRLDVRLAQSKKDVGYYQLSGTSMAAAEVSGVVALLLQAQPSLTNDQVKYRLKATARLATDPATGRATYSIWEQGAGYVQTAAAVNGTTTEASNQNLDLATDLNLDLATHPWGETTYDAVTGTFYFPTIATTPAGYMEWIGAGRTVVGAPSWTGDPTVWSDASRVWRGASRVWRGADMTWAGDEELWAGASRVWRGALPPTIASRASVDPKRLDPQHEYTVYIPGVRT